MESKEFREAIFYAFLGPNVYLIYYIKIYEEETKLCIKNQDKYLFMYG